MIRLLLSGFLLLASPLWADELPALYSVNGVGGDDVLNVRSEPSAGSDVIGTLAANATGVEVIALAKGWALVNIDESTGYVAARFLTRDKGPDWYSLAAPIACFGTEPFWSMSIDPAEDTVTKSAADGNPPMTTPLQTTWPGMAWAPSAAFALPEGLAVTYPKDCSDGMSDRRYGIAIDIFLQSGGGRLSGCCTLAVR